VRGVRGEILSVGDTLPMVVTMVIYFSPCSVTASRMMTAIPTTIESVWRLFSQIASDVARFTELGPNLGCWLAANPSGFIGNLTTASTIK